MLYQNPYRKKKDQLCLTIYAFRPQNKMFLNLLTYLIKSCAYIPHIEIFNKHFGPFLKLLSALLEVMFLEIR